MKHNLDFDIFDGEFIDTEILYWFDKSEYMETPSVPVIQVIFPGFTEANTAPISPNKLNVISTSFLQFTTEKAEFPDGIYHITYAIAPHDKLKVCKWYLRTTQLIGNIQQTLASISIEDKEKISLILEIDKYLLAAKAQVEENHIQANELFKYAQRLYAKLEC